MNLPTAQHYAAKLIDWLTPTCTRINVVGSIRRERPACADIDLICLPKITEHRDMLGAVIARSNHAWDFLTDYVKERNPLNSPGRKPRFISGGGKEGKQLLIDLPKCQLDIWFATETTWPTLLLCRTGSKEHNIWLAQRAQAHGLHWNPHHGHRPLTDTSDPADPAAYLHTPTEEALYTALRLSYIPPKDREIPWLTKHIDSGL